MKRQGKKDKSLETVVIKKKIVETLVDSEIFTLNTGN